MRKIEHKKVSRGNGSLGILAVVFALALIAAAPATANTITFAQYFELTANQEWTIATSPTSTTITATGNELIEFNNTATSYNGTLLFATFTETATSTTAGNCGVACGPGDSLTQTGYSGTFQFTGNALDGALNGVDLLSGTFSTVSPNTGAVLTCSVGGGCGGLSASTSVTQPTVLTFASGIPGLNFAGQTFLEASFSFSSTNPNNFQVGPVTAGTAFPAGGPYTLAASGTFSTSPGFVPEPSSITLIGLGLCGIGLLSRRRGAKVVAR